MIVKYRVKSNTDSKYPYTIKATLDDKSISRQVGYWENDIDAIKTELSGLLWDQVLDEMQASIGAPL